MIIEADRDNLQVVDEIITIVAILEVGEIVDRRFRTKAELLSDEKKSDVLFQLELYQKAEQMTADEMRENGIRPRSFYGVRELRQEIIASLRRSRVLKHLNVVTDRTHEYRKRLLRAYFAGMAEYIYQRQPAFRGSCYVGPDQLPRRINRDSRLTPVSRYGQRDTEPDYVVGLPFDLSVKRSGPGNQITVINLLTMVTWLDDTEELKLLLSTAPHLARKEEGLHPMYNPVKDTVMTRTVVWFNGIQVIERTKEDKNHPLKAQLKAAYLRTILGRNSYLDL